MVVPSQRIVAILRALLSRGAPSRSPRRPGAIFDRLIAIVGALVCLVFTATLRDVGPVFAHLSDLASVPAAAHGDASVRVTVRTANNGLVGGAVVRVFAIQNGRVYLAGDARTASDGTVALTELPRGETWILAYAEGRARASTRLFLEDPASVPGRRREVDLVLKDGAELVVRVIDTGNQPVAGLEVETASSDPLPHLARTSELGLATFDRLPSPPFAVSVAVAGFEPIHRTGVFPGNEPLTLKLERLGGFDVRVEDPDGEPARGAVVLISGPGLWPARSTTTNDDGIATITGLRASVYDLKARQGDLVSKTDLSIPLARGQTLDRTLRLERGRPIRVRVTDGVAPEGIDADPVEGASVLVIEEGLSSFSLEGRTDKNGEVVVGPVAFGGATITARAEGFVPRSARVDPEDDSIVVVPLFRGGTLDGDVVDSRGFPVDGATIEVIGTDADGMPIEERSGRTTFGEDLFAFNFGGPQALIPRGELGVMPGPVPDIPRAGGGSMPMGAAKADAWVTRIDGTFHASPVTPGRVHVLVRHPSYIEEISDVVSLAPGGVQKLHIVLGEGGRLEGRVREDDRTPVAGARIEIAAVNGSFEAVTYTVDDGTFSLAAVPHDVVLTVYRPEEPSEVSARIEVDVPSRGKREVDILLPKMREPVSIRVVDDRGYPINRVEVRATSLDVDTLLQKTLFSDDDGMIDLHGGRGLPLRLVLEHPGHAPLGLTLDPAGKEHRLVMTDGLVAHGSVTAREGRDRLEGASVTLYTATGARHVTTDHEGAFEVKDLAKGRIRIVATAAGYARDETVILFDGDGRRPIDLASVDLSPAGEAEGLVVDANGEPVPGARVAMNTVPTYLPVGRLPPHIAQTDKDGRFVLGGLPEGKLTLVAYSPELGRGEMRGVEIRAERRTDRVKIEIPEQDYRATKTRGAGSVAVTLSEHDDAVVVVDVPMGSEAEYAGLEPDDRLVSIGGAPVRTIEETRSRFSGPLSQDVVLEVARRGLLGDERVRFRVRREVVRR